MEEEIGNGWIEGIHPNDLPLFLETYHNYFDLRQAFAMEYRLKRHDGEYHWLSVRGIPRYDNEGRFEGYIGSCIDITQHKEIELNLQAMQDELHGTLNAIPDILFEWGLDGHIYNYKSSRTDLLAIPPADFLDKQLSDVLSPDVTDICLSALQEANKNGVSIGRQYKILIGQEWKWFELSITRKASLNVDQPRFIVLCRDITERKQAEVRLQCAANVFTYAREGIMITDTDANIIEVNNTFTQITGYSREEALGKNPSMLQSGKQAKEYYAAMWQALADEGCWHGEIWNRCKDGEDYAALLTISVVLDEAGNIQNYMGLFTDITPMKAYQQQLEHIAYYDALTGLPNRVLLADRLQLAMSQSQRRNHSIAVVFLDLDGFKAVNDVHGHSVGDQLLITVGKRMKMALREGDTLARIGGDEFVAVFIDLEQESGYELLLNRLLQAAADPVTVGDALLQVSASIGVTIYPQDDADADQLMRHADQAMYQAKQLGKNRYHVFDLEDFKKKMNRRV
jgi:diguanylate cyclase (GGDEF)-like protein/PAS domain S-box-containing protein